MKVCDVHKGARLYDTLAGRAAQTLAKSPTSTLMFKRLEGKYGVFELETGYTGNIYVPALAELTKYKNGYVITNERKESNDGEAQRFTQTSII